MIKHMCIHIILMQKPKIWICSKRMFCIIKLSRDTLFSKSTKRFLVVYRSKYVNEPNCYGVVGGKIDDTENPKDAVFREISEEVGYDGNINLIPLYIFKTKNFTYHNFLGVIDEEFTPHLDWESDGYKWVTFDELLKIEPKHFGLEKLLNDEESIDIIKKVLN